MSKQINFLISPQMEQELIRFINDECDCKILLPFIYQEKTELKNGDTITLDRYLLIPNSCDLPLQYEQIEDCYGVQKMMLRSFLDSYSFMPFIEYSRLECEDVDPEEFMLARFLCDFMSNEYNIVLREIYRKLKRWIKKKAIKVERDFGTPIYVLDKTDNIPF